MSRIKIGIVEDEVVIAHTIESTLDDLGYEYCGPASSYGEALELLETDKPDLLLLDINLAVFAWLSVAAVLFLLSL